MASRRKAYVKTKNPEKFQPPDVYGAFMSDLLSGTVKATNLVESHDTNGNLTLAYDDPNG